MLPELPPLPPSVVVEGIELAPLVYEGQRVVTFRQIDQVHQRPEGTARRNFNANRQHLIEGEDYWQVSPNEIRTDNPNAGIPASARNTMVLLSESGYLLLAKSLTDDLAWRVQRALVDRYFTTVDNERRLSVAQLDHDTKVEFAAQMLHDPRVVLQAFERMAFHAKVLEDQIDILRPKAAFHDAVNASQGSMTVKRAAQLCGTGQNRMFRWLRDHHYLQAGNQPYQKWLDQGLFEMRIRTFNVDGTTFTRTQPLVTPKGLVRFQREMGCGEAVAFELDANVPGGVL